MCMLWSKIIATLHGIPLQLLPTWLLLFVRINTARTHTCVQSDPKVAENGRGGLGIN